MKYLKSLIVMVVLIYSSACFAQFTNMGNSSKKDSEVNSSAYLQKGFRAIIEAGFSVGYGDVEDNRPVVNTSFGYQFNPYIYLGGGVGAAYFLDSEVVAIPVYLNFRSDFIKYKISPFVDVKAGYSPYDAKGAYASVALGCRFNKFSLSFGTELLQNEYEDWYDTETLDCWGYFAKIGIEF